MVHLRLPLLFLKVDALLHYQLYGPEMRSMIPWTCIYSSVCGFLFPPTGKGHFSALSDTPPLLHLQLGCHSYIQRHLEALTAGYPLLVGKFLGAEVILYGSLVQQNNHFEVLISTHFLDYSSSGTCWYAWLRLIFENSFPQASVANRSSILGMG